MLIIIKKILSITKYCNTSISTRREEFVAFSEALDSERQTPSWLGLPNNAEKVLLTTHGTDMCAKLMKVCPVLHS